MEFKLSKPILAGLAGLSLVFVSACAPADEPDTEDNNAGETAVTEEQTQQPEQTPTETSAEDSETGATDTGDREPLASKDVSFNGSDLTIDLMDVSDDGMLTTIEVKVTNNSDGVFTVGNLFFDGDMSIPGSDGETQRTLFQSSRGIHLVDPKNKKIHRAAFDESGKCLCSEGLVNASLDEDESHTVATSVASPPEDVNEVGIVIPNVGSFPNISLNRD